MQSNTWTGGSSFSQWAAAIATFRPTSAADHFAISYPNGSSAVNCQPQPVTITAHNGTHAAVATAGAITISTSTGHGDWSLTSGSGSFSAGAPNSGAASYTYAISDNGAVTLALRDTVAETVSVNISSGSASETSGSALASEHQTLSFAPSGFRITNGSNAATSIATQVAGKTSAQALALQAIRTDAQSGACTSVFTSGATVNVDLAYQCNNPTSCIAGQTLSVTNGSTTTALAANPNSGVTTYTSVPLKFSTANAEAPFSINYSDVGQVTLAMRYNIPLGNGAGSGNYMTGSSQFIVQPYTFTLSNIKCTTYGAGTCNTGLGSPGNNPGASTATGTVFLPAGQAFTTTVTATNLVGVPTPNYGREIAPQGVTLTPNLVLPAAGHAAAIVNASAFGGFSGGVATGTTFNWPEVGIITLTPGIADYLGSGAVNGTTSGNVGRFVPDHFAVALNTPLFATACSAGSFTYLGQPFGYAVAPVITASAQALGGASTLNYTGSLMRLTNASLTGRSYTPTPASPALTLTGLPATAADPAIADLGNGQASLTFSAGSGIFFARGSAIAPFDANIALSINVLDLDGVAANANPVTFGASGGITFSTGATQRYGRLALRDATGSELLDLPMSLTTQYYAGAAPGFVTNTADSCTSAPQISFSAWRLNLSAGQTCVRDSGSPGSSGAGCSVAAPPGLRYLASAAAGDFSLILAAPGSGHSGAVTLTPAAPSWLQYRWDASAGASSPSGIATFGVFPGPRSRVYQREVY